ncbi:hypothetical protein MRS44_008037 [Fusarium solani]|uniref:uncharacterized protein n=1 Tax=Fusarium solani TaxID=169388 RepID=UPI0032C47450|nr:hypothetical protein MRS44_008037 [Fusarium solani]
MLRAPLRRNVTSALARARTTSSLRTFQAPAQILLQQQRVRIHQKTPDQQQPQPQSKKNRKDAQNPHKQVEPLKTQSKQQKDAQGIAHEPMDHDKDDFSGVLLVTLISDLIHDLTHDCH